MSSGDRPKGPDPESPPATSARNSARESNLPNLGVPFYGLAVGVRHECPCAALKAFEIPSGTLASISRKKQTPGERQPLADTFGKGSFVGTG